MMAIELNLFEWLNLIVLCNWFYNEEEERQIVALFFDCSLSDWHTLLNTYFNCKVLILSLLIT